MTGPARRCAVPALRAAALALTHIACMQACAPTPDRPASPADRTTPAADDRAEPTTRLRDTHRGLEVRVWLAENDAELGIALGELDAGSPPIDPVWAEAGLQLRVVPVSSLESLRARLVTTGVRQSRWIGQPPTAVRLVQGAPHDAFDLVRTGPHARPIDAGSAELFARAWVMPVRTDTALEAALAIELDVTHRPATRPDPFGTAIATRPAPTSTLLSHAATLGVGEALLVVPFDSDARDAPARKDRSRRESIRVPSPAEPAGPAAPSSSRAETEPRDLRPPRGAPTNADGIAGNVADAVAGPRPPRIPTLGELVLPTLPGPTRASTRRPVLVLVPRLPESFPAATPRAR